MAKCGRKPNLYYGVKEVIPGPGDLQLETVLRIPAYKYNESDEHIRGRDRNRAFKAFDALNAFTECIDIWHNNIPEIGPLPVTHPPEYPFSECKEEST